MIKGQKEGIKLEGYTGTWYIIDTTYHQGFIHHLLESELFGDDAAAIITDRNGNVVLDDVYNGFAELDY